MAHDSYISSTAFRLASDASEDAIRGLIEEHMDGYVVHLAFFEPSSEGDRFALESEVAEVGDSFPSRIHALVDAMAPHVAEFFAVTVRNDSMSDDRDEMAYGGPTPEAIQHGIAKLVVDETLSTLRCNPLAMDLLRERLLADRDVVHLKDVHLVATVSGGVLQDVTATHKVALTVVDFDTDGCDEGDLVDVPSHVPGETELASGGKMDVTLDPARALQIEALFESQVAEVQRHLHPRG